jgi:hypothetical protein
MKAIKLRLRDYFLKVADVFSSDIRDSETGESLGRGFLLPLGNRVALIGYRGRPLVPRFLPQQRLTYWNQKIGFSAHVLPDFPRVVPSSLTCNHVPEGGGKVLNILLAHQGGEEFSRLLAWWRPICRQERLWVAFGGSREAFDSLDYPRKVFIDDVNLRTRDHQREKQSYTGILKAMAPIVTSENPDYVYLCEYDQLPLLNDLNNRQIATMQREGADMMGHYLDRIDGTGNPHLLQHLGDPRFLPYWQGVSLREDKGVVLSMFGSGSFWKREAFLAVASRDQSIGCYLEIYLPTMAHHLGFRVRRWSDRDHLIGNLPTPGISIQSAHDLACWTVHPVKEFRAEINVALPKKS